MRHGEEEPDKDTSSPKGAGVCDSSGPFLCVGKKQAAEFPSVSITTSSIDSRRPSSDLVDDRNDAMRPMRM